MPALNVKTFNPKNDQFADMASLLKLIENDPECKKTGIAKVNFIDIFFKNIFQIICCVHSVQLQPKLLRKLMFILNDH